MNARASRSRLTDLGRESRSLVLRALRDRGALARTQLAEHTGLSKAATNGIVDALIGEGRAIECADGTGRQRGVPVALSAHYAKTVGLEVTNDGSVRVVVLDGAGGVLHTQERHFDAAAPPERMAAEVAAIAREALCAEEPVTRAGSSLMPPRLAVGIALPGTVDAREGVARWLHTTGNWFDVPLRSLVGAAVGVPVVVDRRPYTSTLAELRFGAARGVDHVCCLYMGDGIGMGVSAGGRLLRGARDQAGTIAHLQVVSDDSDGPVCHCGMRGCLWAVASVPAILRRVTRAIQEGALSRVRPDAAPALSDVIDAARAGDRLCTDALRVAALATGRAIAACVHVLNPQVVVIGGPLSEAADLLGPLVRAEVERRTFPWLDPKPDVRFSALGPFAAARGAAALASDLLLGLTGEGPYL